MSPAHNKIALMSEITINFKGSFFSMYEQFKFQSQLSCFINWLISEPHREKIYAYGITKSNFIFLLHR